MFFLMHKIYFHFSDLKRCDIIFSINTIEKNPQSRQSWGKCTLLCCFRPRSWRAVSGDRPGSAMRQAFQMKATKHSSQTFMSGTTHFLSQQCNGKAQRETEVRQCSLESCTRPWAAGQVAFGLASFFPYPALCRILS